MSNLYLFLDLGSLLIPFVFSFHPKIKFYKEWPYILPGIIISSIVFLIWDIAFVRMGVWGFNDMYLVGPEVLGLPIEEVLFFICIPYACLFTNHVLKNVLKKWNTNFRLTRAIYYSLATIALFVVFSHIEQAYSAVNFSFFFILITWSYFYFRNTFAQLSISYVILLLPFFLVNGILTGAFIENEVVWYNNAENLNFRFGTVPFEDIFYGFSMLLFPLLISNLLKRIY